MLLEQMLLEKNAFRTNAFKKKMPLEPQNPISLHTHTHKHTYTQTDPHTHTPHTPLECSRRTSVPDRQVVH